MSLISKDVHTLFGALCNALVWKLSSTQFTQGRKHFFTGSYIICPKILYTHTGHFESAHQTFLQSFVKPELSKKLNKKIFMIFWYMPLSSVGFGEEVYTLHLVIYLLVWVNKNAYILTIQFSVWKKNVTTASKQLFEI